MTLNNVFIQCSSWFKKYLNIAILILNLFYICPKGIYLPTNVLVNEAAYIILTMF